MKVKNVYIEITNRCNLNCRTCYNRSGSNTQTHELSVQQIENIINLFSAYGAKRFLFSGGEPTLHSQFNTILDIVEKYNEYAFGFVTNGTSTNQKFIDLVNTRKNLTLQISLDGSNEEQNQKTRGPGHFEKAVEFAKKINSLDLNKLLKMVISQQNLSDIGDFYDLSVSLGFTPEFAFIYKSGNGSDDWDNKKLSPQDKLRALKTIDQLNQKYGIEAFLPKCTFTCPLTQSDNLLSLCIKTDGSVQPCQTLYSQRYTLTNIFNFSEEQLLDNLSQIMSIAKNRTTIDFGCQKCILKDVCGHGCMAEATNISGDPLGNDEACLYRKLQFLNYDMLRVSTSDIPH